MSEVGEEGFCSFSLGRFVIRPLLRDERIFFLFPRAYNSSRELGRKHDSMIFSSFYFFAFCFQSFMTYFLKIFVILSSSFMYFCFQVKFCVFVFLFVAVGFLSLYISLRISCYFFFGFPLYICLFCVLAMI